MHVSAARVATVLWGACPKQVHLSLLYFSLSLFVHVHLSLSSRLTFLDGYGLAVSELWIGCEQNVVCAYALMLTRGSWWRDRGRS